MSNFHKEWKQFLAKWEGATDFDGFMDELKSMESNPIAREYIALAASKYGDSVPTCFKASTFTHGGSTTDDFFCAKSDKYLHNAEMNDAMDEMVRSNDDGWAISDTDIGDE